MKELLELKKKIAKKRPRFIRSDAFKRKCIPMQWRAPKGMQSKIRLKRRGKVSHPGPGVASPRKVRGLTMDGLRPVEIATLKELSMLNPKTDAAVLKKVGMRQRVEILKQALLKKITVLNIREPETLIKSVEDALKSKKEEKKKKEESKQKKKETATKKAEEKKKAEEPKEETQEKPETAKGSKSDKIKTLEKRQ